MKRLPLMIFLLFPLMITVSAGKKTTNSWFDNALQRSESQLSHAAKTFRGLQGNPRTFEKGKVLLVNHTDWTSGFFPGSLWYLYELTGKSAYAEMAGHYQQNVQPAQYRTNTHDLGFILYCSYGNAYRITTNPGYLKILENGAWSLMKRFNPHVGLIKSWEKSVGPWEFPVIIDNMMNLEFLYETGKLTGNQSMMDAAVSHADKTLANHFRSDNSSYHVVDYDSITGKVKVRETHQGFNHESSWARGQAWGLYGFTMMYRLTSNPLYLMKATEIAMYIINHPRMPADKVPFWDFDAPRIPDEPRDASAAAIIASALLELVEFVPGRPEFFTFAEKLLQNLSSDNYLASEGLNGFFILKHATGNKPKKSEIDCPLSYADYYYLEALKRYQTIQNQKNK